MQIYKELLAYVFSFWKSVVPNSQVVPTYLNNKVKILCNGSVSR